VQFGRVTLHLGRGLCSSSRREGRGTCEQQQQAEDGQGCFHVEAH